MLTQALHLALHHSLVASSTSGLLWAAGVTTAPSLQATQGRSTGIKGFCDNTDNLVKLYSFVIYCIIASLPNLKDMLTLRCLFVYCDGYNSWKWEALTSRLNSTCWRFLLLPHREYKSLVEFIFLHVDVGAFITALYLWVAEQQPFKQLTLAHLLTATLTHTQTHFILYQNLFNQIKSLTWDPSSLLFLHLSFFAHLLMSRGSESCLVTAGLSGYSEPGSTSPLQRRLSSKGGW